MAVFQGKGKKKESGSKLKANRKKRSFELGNRPTFTKIGDKKLKIVKGKGGIKKLRLLNIDTANILNVKTKKHQVVKIEDVVENPANRHYVRRDIITKGTIIKTKLGNAKVTSRPAQHGVVNAVLINN